jgi:hypothetical protein
MRLLPSLIAAVSAGLLSTIAAAAPVTIGFEGVVGNGGAQVPVTPYTESGFTFTVSTAGPSNGIFGKDASNSNGSATFVFCAFDSGCTNGSVVTLAGTAPFSLDSIDVGNWQRNAGAGTMELIGHLVGGGTVTTTLATDTLWSTNALSGFGNLLSVDFKGYTTYAVAFDNLVINAPASVPEPASLALAGLALAGVGAAARRKRA